MGSSFSVGPLPKVLEDTIGMLELIDVKFMLLKHVRQKVDKGDPLFLRINDVQKILKLDAIKAFKVMRILDRNNSGFLNYVDFWGGLAMVIRGTPDEKLAFCWELMDVNEDKQMYPHEVFTLMRCVTRAVANIKGNKYVPLESIADLFKQVLKSKNVKLSESGEINMLEFRTFLISHDSSRIYLTNLGSQVTTENKLKLLDNRNEILNNLESMNLEIDMLERQLAWKSVDKECFSKERGGDLELLTLENLNDDGRPGTGSALSGHNTAAESEANKKAIESLNSAMADLSGAASYLQNLVVQRNVNDVPDGYAFDLAAMSSGSASRNSNVAHKNSARDASLIFFWTKSAIDTDGLVVCDDKFLNQICNVIGLELKPQEKADCLNYINSQKTQLNRHHYMSMLTWLKDIYFFISQTSFEVLDNFSAFCQHSYFGFLNRSNGIILSLNNEYQLCQEFEKYMRGDLLYSSSSATASLQGYQALATWQRVRQAAVLCKLTIRCEFGTRPKPPPLKGTMTGTGAGTGTDRSSKQKGSKFDASKFDFLPKWKGIDISIKGQYKSKLDFRAQTEGDHITVTMAEFKAFDNKQVAQLGLNALHKDNPGEKFKLDSFPCIQWISIKLKENINLSQAKCLLVIFKRALNYFKAWVDGYFPQITGNIVTILPDEEDDLKENEAKKTKNKNKKKGEGLGSDSFGELLKGKMMTDRFANTEGAGLPFLDDDGNHIPPENQKREEKKPTQAILIVLFSTINFVEEIEKQLPPGLLITRLFKSFSLKMQLDQTFQSILENMLKSNNFSQKLFGPQEEEMSDDMKNPINFMNAQRELRKDIAFKIMNPDKVPLQELHNLCVEHGYKLGGSSEEQNRRVSRLLRNYLNMVLGGGQLSAFGKAITNKLFTIGSKGTGKIGFWAMNEYIDRFDSKTLYDNREFTELMDSEAIQTHVGEEGRIFITKAGFDSFYERLGQLKSDAAKIRLGSLDELLSGITQLSFEYDPDAVMSMFSLIDNTSYTWSKELLNYFLLGINRNTVTELRLNSLYEFIKRLLDVQLPFLSNPDGFVQALEDFQSLFANGDLGFIPSLRAYCKNTFGKYFEWEDVFADFWHKLKENNVEKHELEKLAAENGEEVDAEEGGGDGSSLPPTAASAKSGGGDSGSGEAGKEETEETEEEKMLKNVGGFTDYLERFRELLPPSVKANSFRQQSKVIDKEKKFLVEMLELEQDRLSRNDIEDIKRILENIDAEFAILFDEKATLERSMFAYCLLLYDVFRIFCLEFCTFGVGFEEFTISGHVSGMFFNNIPAENPDDEENNSSSDARLRANTATTANAGNDANRTRTKSTVSDTQGKAAEVGRPRGDSDLGFAESSPKKPGKTESAVDDSSPPPPPPPFLFNLFLKGDGDRPTSQQYLIDKLQRSIHRKQNAIAYLRRQKQKKQDELDGQTQSQDKRDEDEMYEFQLLSEIQEISKNDTSTMERLSKAQFKRLSRKWEEFGQFFMQAGPNATLKLVISLSNSAVTSIMANEVDSVLQNIDIMEVAANSAFETFIGGGSGSHVLDVKTLSAKEFSNPQVFTTYFIIKNYVSVLNANKMDIPSFAKDFFDAVTPIVTSLPQFRDCTIVQCFPGYFVYLLPWVKEISESQSLADTEDIESLDDDFSVSKSSGIISKRSKASKGTTKVSKVSTVDKIDKIRQRRELYDLIASNEISKIFQNVATGKTDVSDFSKYISKKSSHGHAGGGGHADDNSTINSKQLSFDHNALKDLQNSEK